MVEWVTSCNPVAYPDAVAAMEAHVEAMLAGQAGERVWLLEHPPLYTAGTSAEVTELLTQPPFPVYHAGRGGRYTYHGPGQRIIYVMADLRQRGRDVRAYVQTLEAWIIAALAEFSVDARQRAGRVGLWVVNDIGQEEKIAAIGVRVRRWISFHGVAVNVAPNLSHFNAIIPCGLAGYGVTSLQALGKTASLPQLDAALQHHWPAFFAVL